MLAEAAVQEGFEILPRRALMDLSPEASETLNVTIELVRRGYTEKQIKKLWGENLLRVLDEVQEVAKKIQAGKI